MLILACAREASLGPSVMVTTTSATVTHVPTAAHVATVALLASRALASLGTPRRVRECLVCSECI
jgi:hypothetical protein